MLDVIFILTDEDRSIYWLNTKWEESQYGKEKEERQGKLRHT